MSGMASALVKAFLTALALSFGWTLLEVGTLLLWPGFQVVRVFVDLLAYSILPMFPARAVKGIFPRGIPLGPILATSLLILMALALGRSVLFFFLTLLVRGSLLAYLSSAALLEGLLLGVAFFFALRSFQEGSEFSARAKSSAGTASFGSTRKESKSQ